MLRISFAELSALLRDVFVNAGVTVDHATILGENCAMCERDGSLSHGVFRIPGYLASLRSGWVDGQAIPVVQKAASAYLRVNARNGFAQPALAAARLQLTDMARDAGAAVLAIRDSHHFSALWPDIELFAVEGFVAIAVVGGLACVAPAAGAKPQFGTNPIAFAAPVAGGNPLIFDQSTSAISNGDLRIAALKGATIPEDAGVDRFGQPSVDPQAVLDGGALLPFGGYKGASIALMVEILAAALTGGQFSHEVDFSGYPGAETPRTGQLIIVINPERGNAGDMAKRVAELLSTLRAGGVSRLPGDRRYARRAESDRDGIALDPNGLRELRAWAAGEYP
jgi:delta1-piperideine-2-carboxylate reductase